MSKTVPVRDADGDTQRVFPIDLFRGFLHSTGDPDPEREGLEETPARMAKAWAFWTSGYNMRAEDILKCFEDGAEGCDEMVVRKNIPIYSKCEHHLADIFGFCTIAYIPSGKVVGLSKMDRLADMYARRLQVQERMTNQIADAMDRCLSPHGVGVWISARHMCVESRGVQNQNSETVTIALRGAMKTDPRTREEFLAAARC
ncbi:FolE GTP cyclohydrolase I [uncultured Caudovirales phage]|uniref:GTP cyclohydrolase I n=1 Tax=uncultured Caudovirales phage TaxID=2100421 RepID=A0A6J5RLJ7_9CAUD|nr:FolE GTP cyclohydrolase I [uncultured Caudovirales phage]